MILAPDEHQAAIWDADLKGNISPGAAIAFAHGLNVHFGLIEPPADIDVIIIAPKVPDHTECSEYVRGGGVPCLITFDQGARDRKRVVEGKSVSGRGGLCVCLIIKKK